ncbi:MAG: response regulator, partial [Bacteroidota bacterium]
MPRTVLLIDDEAPARNLLREYLTAYPEFEVIEEAANGVEALERITRLRPDIVFLDVQMPGLTGLEVISQLNELPLVVFSTAYDGYALEAFDFHAVDYLLKPYTADRFARAVDRLRERLGDGGLRQPNVARLVQQLREEAAPTRYPDRLMVDRGGKYVALPVADLLFVRAD